MANNGYKINNSLDGHLFWFTSTGQKGSVIKVISMQPMRRTSRYNLAMADVVDGDLDYDNISDNFDLDRLSATVAAVVKQFTLRFPAAEIYFQGNSAVKTRLYRIKISNNLEKIRKEFNVYGIRDESFQLFPFEKGENYIGILVSRK